MGCFLESLESVFKMHGTSQTAAVAKPKQNERTIKLASDDMNVRLSMSELFNNTSLDS